MEDSDTLPDIVLNKPIGTSTPTHTSEALSPTRTPTPISPRLPPPLATNVLLQQKRIESRSNPDPDDKVGENRPLLGVTTDLY